MKGKQKANPGRESDAYRREFKGKANLKDVFWAEY